MYVSSINSLMSFKQTQKKYEQPSVREQLPSMVLGAIVGGIGGTVYGCTKNLKGKKTWLVHSGFSCRMCNIGKYYIFNNSSA